MTNIRKIIYDNITADEREKELVIRKITRLLTWELCDNCCSVAKMYNVGQMDEDKFREIVLNLTGCTEDDVHGERKLNDRRTDRGNII